MQASKKKMKIYAYWSVSFQFMRLRRPTWSRLFTLSSRPGIFPEATHYSILLDNNSVFSPFLWISQHFLSHLCSPQLTLLASSLKKKKKIRRELPWVPTSASTSTCPLASGLIEHSFYPATKNKLPGFLSVPKFYLSSLNPRFFQTFKNIAPKNKHCSFHSLESSFSLWSFHPHTNMAYILHLLTPNYKFYLLINLFTYLLSSLSWD